MKKKKRGRRRTGDEEKVREGSGGAPRNRQFPAFEPE